MRHFRFYIIIALLGWALSTEAQDLDQHRWKDRLILVYSEERESKALTQQLEELASDMKGFEERRLVIYAVSGDYFRKGFKKGPWQRKNQSMDTYFPSEKAFEVVLLGLDGGVKLRQDHLLTRNKLYSTIDAMPMRQRELKNSQ